MITNGIICRILLCTGGGICIAHGRGGRKSGEGTAVFCFLDTTLGPTCPFLSLDSATIVTFLAAAFFFSMEANTSRGTTYSS
jgi:hypothetical protein